MSGRVFVSFPSHRPSFLLASIRCRFHTVSPSASDQYGTPDSSVCGSDLFLGVIVQCHRVLKEIRMKRKFKNGLFLARFPVPKKFCGQLSTQPRYHREAPLGLFSSPEFIGLVVSRYPRGRGAILGQETGADQRHEGPRCKLSSPFLFTAPAYPLISGSCCCD